MESTGPAAAVAWLAAAAPDPEACRREWERSSLGIALLPAGRLWDVLIVPGRLGRPAVRLFDALPGGGPALHDPGDDTVAFFVPVGTAGRWIGTGVRGAGEGTWVMVPHPLRAGRGLRWLLPPDGSGALTDPMVLELVLHEAAAGVPGPGEHL
ncbi:hypothetical protein [Kitasatospora viridis]|uniref:Bifunctional DNA primase/polymerase-like protein n=1 Tax=Kitasatospora viridis TaxID=281105 RepID=A0A561UEA1_9ACTN|nr:hypothetical protein [Kitasatospora viridis]TWF97702.1 hypothetical protein FHX73_111497 [Kitasatospora viridis]